MIRIAIIITLLAGPVIAQPSDVARSYIEASGFANSVASLVPSIIEQEEMAMRQAMPMANEEAMMAYLDFYADELYAKLSELETNAAELADVVFTEVQMQEIVTFLETEIGKAYVEGSVRAQEGIFVIIQDWAAIAGQEAAQQAQNKLKDKGLEL